jgi:xylan 1,4-beta-xylosidase
MPLRRRLEGELPPGEEAGNAGRAAGPGQPADRSGTADEPGVLRADEREGRERAFLNFTYLDEIFDTMLEHGARPFVELGFMPSALASGSQTVFWWKGNVTPPSDWELWSEPVRGMVSHWIAR